jgi:hypothetical protein
MSKGRGPERGNRRPVVGVQKKESKIQPGIELTPLLALSKCKKSSNDRCHLDMLSLNTCQNKHVVPALNFTVAIPLREYV